MIPIALGLFSVRHALEQDMPGTLAAVRALGYTGVEFFGAFTHPAKEVAAALKAAGLRCCGWHTPFDALGADQLEATIAYHQEIDNPYMVVPGFPAENTATIADWQRTAEAMNTIAAKLPAGIKTGYHNHNTEFKRLESKIPWDVFWEMADPALIMQLDLGNALYGGADVVEIMRKYPKRGDTLHIKPYSKSDGFDTMIGKDDIPWDTFFAEAESQNVTQWYIVEYESEVLYTPMDGVRRTFEAMKKLGKA